MKIIATLITLVIIYFIYINIIELNKEKSDELDNTQIKKNKRKINAKKIKDVEKYELIQEKINDLVQQTKEKKEKKKEKEKEKKEDLVFMDIAENDNMMGRITILLYSDIVPKTCENFRMLCHGKKNLTYKNSLFHRIITDFMIQGGDFTRGDGRGGMSIFGEKFEDENFDIPHDQPYLLSMANSGPNTNGSQFFITTSELPHLDGKHVVFGRIIDGFDIIDYLNNIETIKDDRPKKNIKIVDCGII